MSPTQSPLDPNRKDDPKLTRGPKFILLGFLVALFGAAFPPFLLLAIYLIYLGFKEMGRVLDEAPDEEDEP